MIRILIALTTIALSLPAAVTAACAVPPTYRKLIEDRLSAKYPNHTDFSIRVMEPRRVLVGDKKTPMCAVRCYWNASQKETRGGRLLGSTKSDFLFEGGAGLLAKVREALPDERIEWLDGEPVPVPQVRRKG